MLSLPAPIILPFNMSDEVDLLIKNAFIVDGTGSPGYEGALLVEGERTTAVGKVEGELKAEARKTIDAKGKVVTPGFIDVHNHGDLSILYYPKADGFVRQGITTFVGGNCGDSPGPLGDWIGLPWIHGDIYRDVAPRMYDREWVLPRGLFNERHREVYGWEIDWHTMGEFFKRVESMGMSPNYAPLVGHGDIRSMVMGSDYRRTAKKKEVREMRKHVEQAMEDGCIGISVGRDYDPGIWADFDEILACSKVVAKYGGLYTSHCLRTGHRKARRPGEPAPIALNGVLEAIDVGRKAKMPVQISHLGNQYVVTPEGSRSMTEAAIKETFKVIDDAREEGIDVCFDVIPHHQTGGIGVSPGLISLLRPWLSIAGSPGQLAKALQMEDFREEIKASIWEGKHYGLNPNIRPTWAGGRIIKECKEEKFIDKTVAQIAEDLGMGQLDALMHIIMVDPETKAISRRSDDDWVKLEYFKHPHVMIGVDTFAVDETREGRHKPPSLPNENSFGGFPRYIRRAVVETKTLSIEEAIRKITSSPARMFKLKDRGVLKVGAYADIVIMNLETITDRGNQLEPRQYPEGIEHVIINGTVVVENTKQYDDMPGKILYRD